MSELSAILSIKFIEIVTLLAIFLGPICAVIVTRFVDSRRNIHERRMEIFRMLMRTRKHRLSAEHVYALNLIEVEFYRDNGVLAHFKKYMDHMTNDSLPFERWISISDDLFTNLVQIIGLSVGYKIEQLDIYKGGYHPRGWENTEQEQAMFRKMMLELLQGKRSIPITNMYQITPGGTFPPPPSG